MSDPLASSSFDVQVHLKAFARTISSEPLGLAVHRPEAWAKPTRCFENANHQAQRRGGRVLFGWMFHYRVVAHIPGPGYLIAVHHAVWHAPTGELIDVTPFHDDPKHHPISPGGDVLFLVDTKAQPVAVNSAIAPMPSRHYALEAMNALPPTFVSFRNLRTRLAGIFTQACVNEFSVQLC